MNCLVAPMTLTDGINIRFFSSSFLSIALIQSIFNIQRGDLYLEGLSKNLYLPNDKGVFSEFCEDILMIQPTVNQIIPETIIVNYTDARYLFNHTDYNPSNDDCLEIGYNVASKYIIRTLIKFEELESLIGKKILKAYLYLTGRARKGAHFNADPKEMFCHKLLEKYSNPLKWTEMPRYDPKPETSIIVGETNEETFSIDITSLVVNWLNGIFPNYGILLKGNDIIGVNNLKGFKKVTKPPHLRIICLPG